MNSRCSPLEAWAARNARLLLVVSPDRDWQDYAGQSELLIAVSDVAAALDYVNGNAAFVVARCMALLAPGEESELKIDIEAAIESFGDVRSGNRRLFHARFRDRKPRFCAPVGESGCCRSAEDRQG